MKILRIIARLNVGGPARHVVWLTKTLQDTEFQTTLITGSVPAGEDDMSYFAQQNGVEPLYIPEMSREISASDIKSLLKIYRILKLEQPDVIHTHTAKAGTLGRLAGWMYRWLTWRTLIGRPRPVRMVHTFHGHVFHSYYGRTKTAVFLVIERMLAHASDRIIVLSEQQLDEINVKFRVGRRGNFSIVPLGIDVDHLGADAAVRERLRSELSFSESDFIVGFVGRLTEIKNISLLLKTASLFRSDPGVRFVIVGDGNLRSALEAEAASLDLGGSMRFLGNRTDIADVYNLFDVVALTSRNEGTPLSLIESMAAGRPVISTGVGGVRDLLGTVVEDHGNFAVCERGVRVDSFQPADLHKGLKYLIENKDERTSMAGRGRKYILENYSKERLVRDIKRLYRELLS